MNYEDDEDKPKPETFDGPQTVQMTERQYELELRQHSYAGHAAQCEEMANKCRELAGLAFTKERDEEAKWYREMAKFMALEAHKWRKKQNQVRVQLGQRQIGGPHEQHPV